MLNTNISHLGGVVLDKSVLLDNLNAALKSQLSNAYKENSYIILARLVEVMDPVNIATDKDVWVQAFASNQVDGNLFNIQFWQR